MVAVAEAVSARLASADAARVREKVNDIEDVALRQQVRHRARFFGVSVPQTPVPEPGGEEDQS